MSNKFKGSWITAQEILNNGNTMQNFHIKIRKSFTADCFEKASIKITADDCYKLYINGSYVGQGPAPGYTFAYNYNEYDITKLLKAGENVIEATVYYQGLINRVFVSGDNRFGMAADIYFDDKFSFGTDESWQYCIDNSFTCKRTVGYDTAFLEDRDLRIKDSEYKNCAVAATDYTFCNAPFPALQIYSIKTCPIIRGNRYFYDFEQEYVCNLRITVSAETSGKKIIIHCGEELDNNGNVRFHLRCGCDYEEVCILNEGENSIEQFDYKAFRYLEIIADDGVAVDNAEILVRHYPFPKNSLSLNSDDDNLCSVFNLCKNTIKYGTQEAFVDCPTREKGQYIGDVFISGFAHFYLTRDPRMLKKAIENIAQSIKYSGEILAVSPCSLKQKIADYSLLFPQMLLKYYKLTGDRDFLLKMLPACDFISNYFEKFADKDGLLNKVDEQWNLVDWPDNLRDGYDFDLTEPVKPGRHNVINAFYIACVQSIEEIKKELSIPCENKSKKLKESFNKVFFNTDTQLYVDCEGSTHSAIHSNMLPLSLDICPCEYKENIADYLAARGMCCGTYMSYFYLKALCLAGRKQAAYAAIISDGENSWLNMIKEGATTCFEAWGKEKKWNTSLFHPWSCTPILILYEHFPYMFDSLK